jgi:hypothetical protein
MTAPTATADDLHWAAKAARFVHHAPTSAGDGNWIALANRLEALAVRYELMLEVVAAAEALVEWWDPRDTDGWTRLQAAVRALREAPTSVLSCPECQGFNQPNCTHGTGGTNR